MLLQWHVFILEPDDIWSLYFHQVHQWLFNRLFVAVVTTNYLDVIEVHVTLGLAGGL